MGGARPKWGAMLAAAALAATACGSEAAPPATATSSTTPTTSTTTTTTTSTTTTTVPSGPAFIERDARGAEVVALQILLTCAGYGTLKADGVFGDRTAASVERAQEGAGRSRTGEPDAELFAFLARQCDREEEIPVDGGGGSVTVIGNVAPGDPDRFLVEMSPAQLLRLETGDPIVLTVVGPAGGSLDTGRGRLLFESPAAGTATIVVEADGPTTYRLEGGLTEASGDPGDLSTVVGSPFDAADWIGMEWAGALPGGLVDHGRVSDCAGDPPGCAAHFGVIVAAPGSFSGSGADNPIEAMAWLIRPTGASVGDEELWEIVDAEVLSAPIGNRVLLNCTLRAEDGTVVAFADLVAGTVNGAIDWDVTAGTIDVLPPDRIVCIDGSGDVVAVGPGFG